MTCVIDDHMNGPIVKGGTRSVQMVITNEILFYKPDEYMTITMQPFGSSSQIKLPSRTSLPQVCIRPEDSNDMSRYSLGVQDIPFPAYSVLFSPCFRIPGSEAGYPPGFSRPITRRMCPSNADFMWDCM